MRTLLVLAISCMLATSCEASEAPARALDSSLQIQVSLGDNWVTLGSAVEVRDSNMGLSVITARHVAEFSQAMPMRACTEDGVDCTVLGNYYSRSSTAETSDWAVFQIAKKIPHTWPANLGVAKHIGETVWQIGNPHGVPVCSKGELSYSAAGEEGSLLVVHGFGYPGSSGGGVFNESGELIGIMVAVPVWADADGSPSLMTDLTLVVPIQQIGILK